MARHEHFGWERLYFHDINCDWCHEARTSVFFRCEGCRQRKCIHCHMHEINQQSIIAQTLHLEQMNAIQTGDRFGDGHLPAEIRSEKNLTTNHKKSGHAGMQALPENHPPHNAKVSYYGPDPHAAAQSIPLPQPGHPTYYSPYVRAHVSYNDASSSHH